MCPKSTTGFCFWLFFCLFVFWVLPLSRIQKTRIPEVEVGEALVSFTFSGLLGEFGFPSLQLYALQMWRSVLRLTKENISTIDTTREQHTRKSDILAERNDPNYEEGVQLLLHNGNREDLVWCRVIHWRSLGTPFPSWLCTDISIKNCNAKLYFG